MIEAVALRVWESPQTFVCGGLHDRCGEPSQISASKYVIAGLIQEFLPEIYDQYEGWYVSIKYVFFSEHE
jgi:hypothetical protein